MNAFAIVKDSFSQHCDVESNLIYDGCKDLKPEITVAIPTFRRPDLLRESVKSALTQETSVVYEVIVVDNEQDGNWSELVDEVLAEFMPANLRLFRNSKNIGMFGNWNRCISLARGKWVTILNDDDLLFSGFLDLVSTKRVGRRMVSCNVISTPNPCLFSKVFFIFHSRSRYRCTSVYFNSVQSHTWLPWDIVFKTSRFRCRGV